LSSHSLAERFWALDPIDGTKGFLRGDQYAIALALVENREVKLGVLACPNLHVDIRQPRGKRGCIFLWQRFESLRAGLPAIVTEKTGTKEIVSEYGTEFIRKVNPIDLAEGFYIISQTYSISNSAFHSTSSVQK
jgi:3'(2'), 5'-bisphosphate nucleotidase